jgi:putative pyruvate formate lyase activating enzyme
MVRSWTSSDRLERARRHYALCNLCEHRCGVSRVEGQRGPCKAGVSARVFKHRVEYGEEREIVPSLLFYLSGCDLRCCFCIAEENAFDPGRGRELTSELFRDAVAEGVREGAKTLQWVGGEPTIHLPSILEVMAACSDLPPVVWKSDFYGTPEAFELLNGVADVYIADFKFGNNECARRLAGVDRYVEVVTRNLLAATQQGNLIVRHLLLPGHQECCYAPIIAWLHDRLPGVKFSLRDCYLPRWRAHRFEEIARPLARDEARPAREMAVRVGLNLIA